jgi:hypothetical protein
MHIITQGGDDGSSDDALIEARLDAAIAQVYAREDWRSRELDRLLRMRLSLARQRWNREAA